MHSPYLSLAGTVLWSGTCGCGGPRGSGGPAPILRSPRWSLVVAGLDVADELDITVAGLAVSTTTSATSVRDGTLWLGSGETCPWVGVEAADERC